MSESLQLLFPVGVDLVDLPSQGNFYGKDHPLCNNKCVEIMHMRGAEEDILANRDYIKKDIVLDKLLKSLIKDSDLKLDKHYNKLLVADQVAMIVRARTTAYTWHYPTLITCPACKTSVEFSFDLRKMEVKFPNLENDKNISYDAEKNRFVIKMPNVDLTFVTLPLTVEVQKKISNKLLSKKDKILTSKEKLEDFIVSVNNIETREIVEEFFKHAPAFYVKWLETAIADTNINISFAQEFHCDNCDHREVMEPPFTIDFLFTPKIKREK